MNKFTKISATALLALFLTACDKPADKAPETKPEAAQTQAVSEVKVDEKGDYQKLVDWNKAQEQTQLQSQQKFQQDLVAAVQAQDEKAESIKSIKEQTKNVLSLASGLLVDQANMSFINPTQTPEQQKAYAEKAEALRNAMAELQKQSIELEQKFNPAPVAAPAQDAK